FLSGNPLTTLTMAMAAAKTLVDAAAQVEGASIVTTMARNGSGFGIRLGNQPWIVSNAQPIKSALFRPGYGPEVAAPDIGDSAVLELIGLGAAVAGNTPASPWIGSSITATVRGPIAASTAARSFSGTLGNPVTLGSNSASQAGLPEADMVASVRPWKPWSMVMIS
ncbi:MAG: DUF1116 domain-containing protein, partial [Rhodospirillales bacterium]|nr:DUF1116 domain-containing protein [Rhodospirillales bacterium]